jgi:hypothetical protein
MKFYLSSQERASRCAEFELRISFGLRISFIGIWNYLAAPTQLVDLQHEPKYAQSREIFCIQGLTACLKLA